MKKTQETNDKALTAFMARKTEIDALLGDLKAWSDEHFGATPEEVNWGQVGTLDEWLALLGRIADFSKVPRREP